MFLFCLFFFCLHVDHLSYKDDSTISHRFNFEVLYINQAFYFSLSVTTMFNETTGMNLTIVTNATMDEWELIMSHVQYVRLILIIISLVD